MSSPSMETACRIQPIRILNPRDLEGNLIEEEVVAQTGLPIYEVRFLADLDGLASKRDVQRHILTRDRGQPTTVRSACRWLGVRGIDIPDSDAFTTATVAELLSNAMHLSDRYGYRTAHHICADDQYLQFLGPDFLTVEDLNIVSDWEHETAAHWAALNGNLRQIPSRLLTPDVALNTDHVGRNLLHFAAIGHCLGDVPPHYLTHRNLFLNDAMFNTNVETIIGEDVVDWAELPWNRISPHHWLEGLDDLMRIATVCGSSRLARFAILVQRTRRLKAIETFTGRRHA